MQYAMRNSVRVSKTITETIVTNLVVDDHNPAVILQGYDNMCTMNTVLIFTTASMNVQEMFLEIFHGQNGFTVQPNNF